MSIQSSLIKEVRKKQHGDPVLHKFRDDVLTGKTLEFSVIYGVLKFQSKLCIPSNNELKQKILT